MSDRHVVDFPLSFEEMEPVFDVMNFLDENREELIQKFKPQVVQYLERAKYFPSGIMKQAHQSAFADLIASLIKNEIESHFEFNPEQLILLTERPLLGMLAGELFDEKVYLK